MASPADIVIMGGAAGGGKTFTLVTEPLRHLKRHDFSAIMFRRLTTQVRGLGAIWDESEKWYPRLGARPNESDLLWTFPSSMRVKMAHMEYAKNRFDYDGWQVPLVIFDQLESFEEIQFWYMLSRQRSTSGVRPYVRASCNPIPDDDPTGGWLHRLIQWWINPDTGLAIQERSGKIRWFVRTADDQLIWSDDPISLTARYPESRPKSLTFILARLEDNPAMLRVNPDYKSNLLALPLIERERLLGGNWNVRPEAGKVFNRAWFEIVDAVPAEVMRARGWDKAGTEGAGDWTAGVRIAKSESGLYFVEDVIRGQWGSMARNNVIRQTASMDGFETEIALEQEPGSGGKESAEISIRELAGYNVHAHPSTGSKLTRALPMSAQAEAGNIKIVRGSWNKAFVDELHGFTGTDGATDDQVDGATNAFNRLALRPGPLRLWSAGSQPTRSDGNQEPSEEEKKIAEQVVLDAIRGTGVYWPAGRP